jgi:hypothetical protein
VQHLTRRVSEGRGARFDSPHLPILKIVQSGKRCVDKVEMVEETEYDDVMTCDHSYDRRCHTSYTTTYEAQQVSQFILRWSSAPLLRVVGQSAV